MRTVVFSTKTYDRRTLTEQNFALLLDPATRHLVNGTTIAAMKRGVPERVGHLASGLLYAGGARCDC